MHVCGFRRSVKNASSIAHCFLQHFMMVTSVVKHGKHDCDLTMSWLRASLRRNRTPILRNVAPETVLEAFRMHWLRTQQLMEKSSLSGTKPTADDITGVLNHLDQMVNFLVEEATTSRNSTTTDGQCSADAPNDASSDQAPLELGPIVDFLLAEGVLDKLFQWSLQAGEFLPVLKQEQLRVYEVLVSHSQHELLLQHGFLRPLLHLLGSCGECGSPVEVEKRLVVLLNTLCVSLSQHPHLLQLFFTTGTHQPARFLIFSLLIPFVHREGSIGQQARDALLLCMALSRKNQSVGLYIAEHSNFCPVLATGLSGLYSVLPRKLPIMAEDWHKLTPEDIQELPELAMFLNSLEFCNAVIQVSHPTVQEQLLEYIYQGFLVPVLGPALHQDTVGIDVETLESSSFFSNTLEEIVTATAYLELFLRTVTEPQLLMVLFRFVLTEKYEDHLVVNTLINRLGSHSRLCLVTMALFRTLLDFNCEDVMLELVFKYLIPCSHVMVSQRSRVRDVDFYSMAAEKFLSLIPSSCHTSSADESPISRNLRHPRESLLPDDVANSEGSFRAKGGQRRSISTTFPSSDSSAAESPKMAQNGSQWHVSDDTGYHLYLLDARHQVRAVRKACTAWSSSYDGSSSDTNGVTPDRTECGGDDGSVSAGDSGVFVTKEGVKGGFEAFGSPDIGPFLGILLARLEMMPQNDVYTNLQLTSLVSRLALYPQPLLRSFLLSHSLVFQPSIRSLFQVLGSLKHKVDSYSHTLPNFEELLGRARQFFVTREERLLGEGPPRHYGGDAPVRRSYSFSQGFIRGDAKRRSFSNLFRRLGDRASPRAPALQSIPDQRGYRYISSVSRDTEEDLKLESIKTRHAVLCAVVLEEFLKELAAISQEHAVQQLAL
ncbi:FHF complex subunit HOOK-interacting protein 1B-like isoform X3 [Ornithodoros turicata]|uniref:FHF complex subunit HOOK-interacting protein 1B-like isoform X3 n=1 Tax=Ornithodoros turicata TaxID=34597 RepID=UPI00313974FC